jgi:plasmid replication initiation protein
MARKVQKPGFIEHVQLSLFFAEDIIEPNFRDDRDIMSYPFLSMQKQKRIEPIYYRNDKQGIEIKVESIDSAGIATIFDYDFILWIISIINEAIEEGKETSPRVRFYPHQFLLQAGWISSMQKGGGLAYKRLARSLERLKKTTITTNIRNNKEGDIKSATSAFSWINEYHWYEHKGKKIDHVEIILADWIYDRIKEERTVLSISPEYFSLTSAMAKMLYRICRKHCGNQDVFKFKVSTLYSRYPTNSKYSLFKYRLKQLVKKNILPEYNTSWHIDKDRYPMNSRKPIEYVIISPRPGSREARKLPRTVRHLLEGMDL